MRRRPLAGRDLLLHNGVGFAGLFAEHLKGHSATEDAEHLTRTGLAKDRDSRLSQEESAYLRPLTPPFFLPGYLPPYFFPKRSPTSAKRRPKARQMAASCPSISRRLSSPATWPGP